MLYPRDIDIDQIESFDFHKALILSALQTNIEVTPRRSDFSLKEFFQLRDRCEENNGSDLQELRAKRFEALTQITDPGDFIRLFSPIEFPQISSEDFDDFVDELFQCVNYSWD